MMRRDLLAAAIVAVALTTSQLGAAKAEGYVCSRVPDADGEETGPSLSWPTRDIPFVLHALGSNKLSGDSEFAVLRDSFAQWGTVVAADSSVGGGPVQECDSPNRYNDLVFREASSFSTRSVLGYNFISPSTNENILLFRDDEWLHPGQAATTLALTTTTYNPVTGIIFDADIEFNSANFDFTTTNTTVVYDLMNTAVHEIGHLVGLAHTSDRDATMFRAAEATEVYKRSLHCSDSNGVVFKYPAAEANGYCQPVAACGFCAPPNQLTRTAVVEASSPREDNSSCMAAPISSPLAWLLLLLGVRLRRRSAIQRP